MQSRIYLNSEFPFIPILAILTRAKQTNMVQLTPYIGAQDRFFATQPTRMYPKNNNLIIGTTYALAVLS